MYASEKRKLKEKTHYIFQSMILGRKEKVEKERNEHGW